MKVILVLTSLLLGTALSVSLHAQQADRDIYPAVNDACVKRSGLQPNGVMLECSASVIARDQQQELHNSIELEIRSDGSRHLLHSVLNVSDIKWDFLLSAPRTPQPIVEIILPSNAHSATVQNSLRTVLEDASNAGMTDIFIRPTNERDLTIKIRSLWLPPDQVTATRAGDRLPMFRQQAPLQYPSSEQGTHHNGTTLLVVGIDESGHVSDIQVRQSSGYDDLDKSCAAMVKGSSFWPLISNGVAQKSAVTIPCHF